MTIGTKIYTFLCGQRVGVDEFGNTYYQQRRVPKGARRKRWVMYRGKAEASKVPPHWHGWLHYTLESPPTETPLKTYAWQRGHLPNLTGTKLAYMPPGHVLKGAKRAASTSDYEPWQPK